MPSAASRPGTMTGAASAGIGGRSRVGITPPPLRGRGGRRRDAARTRGSGPTSNRARSARTLGGLRSRRGSALPRRRRRDGSGRPSRHLSQQAAPVVGGGAGSHGGELVEGGLAGRAE